jgi:hypothetical protein
MIEYIILYQNSVKLRYIYVVLAFDYQDQQESD